MSGIVLPSNACALTMEEMEYDGSGNKLTAGDIVSIVAGCALFAGACISVGVMCADTPKPTLADVAKNDKFIGVTSNDSQGGQTALNVVRMYAKDGVIVRAMPLEIGGAKYTGIFME